jgi:hypothetical protein
MRVLGADADGHAVPNALTAGLDRDALRSPISPVS